MRNTHQTVTLLNTIKLVHYILKSFSRVNNRHSDIVLLTTKNLCPLQYTLLLSLNKLQYIILKICLSAFTILAKILSDIFNQIDVHCQNLINN